MPRAVQIELELDGLGILNWLFMLPETFVAGSQNQSAGQAQEGDGEADTDTPDEEGSAG